MCNGVLHHTADPLGGFKSIQQLVRPGGHIVIGLYNTYGRLMLDLRRNIFRLTGGRGKWLDAYLRGRFTNEAKRKAWFNDQYRHPHESKHTIGEVLGWFDQCGLEFVRGVPNVTLDGEALGKANLFKPTDKGTALDHFLVQAREVVTGNQEGGFFIMIAKKPLGPISRSTSAGTNGHVASGKPAESYATSDA
jgi:SAM-dependent methyltransferase